MAKKWKEKGYFNREQSQHTSTIDSYFIGKYPVTVDEYRAFVIAGGYLSNEYWTKAGWSWRETVGKFKPDFWENGVFIENNGLPVVGVS